MYILLSNTPLYHNSKSPPFLGEIPHKIGCSYMNNQYRFFLAFWILNIVFSATSFAQSEENQSWSAISETEKSVITNAVDLPKVTSLYRLNHALINKQFTDLQTNNHQSSYVKIPLPNDSLATYIIRKTSIVEPELLKKYPFLQTYSGHAVDDPNSIIRLSYDKNGFHAFLKKNGELVCVDPVRAYADHHIYKSYTAKNWTDHENFQCHTKHINKEANSIQKQTSVTSIGDQIRTFRIAISTTGEYAAFHGGTVEQTLSAVVNTLNRVNLFFESELSTRFILVAENDQLIFTNPLTDPFNNNDINSIITENQYVINDLIGIVNYDLGHVFGTAGGGLAGVGAICTPVKSWGATGLSSPEGDVFDIVYVAHEIGHQLNASHSFNNCNGQNGGATAYEPGSGTTIMAYAGLCGSNNIQDNTDFFFHAGSHERIANSGCNCASYIPSENTPPSVEAIDASGLTIPISTPFELMGMGTDADGDILTYSWDQMDRGPVSPLGSPIGSAPTFRFQPPTTEPIRSFPNINSLVQNIQDVSEVLPDYERVLNFRITARDNNIENGGFAFDDYQLNVTESAGPFLITYPSFSDIIWEVGEQRTIEWQVANTNIGVVNCPEVSIYLSKDGGFTYPILLAEAVPNSGSYELEVPSEIGENCRIKIKGHNHVFFDISNTSFSIIEGQTSDSNPESALAISTQINSTISCYDGEDAKVTVTPFGGQAPYLYSKNGVDFQPSNVFDHLHAGVYVFAVKDGQGQISTTEPIEIENPELIEIEAEVMEDQAIIDARGGTGQLKYSLDGLIFQPNPVFTNLNNGDYTVTVRDNNLCRAEEDFEVANNTLSMQVQVLTEPSCTDSADGSIQVNTNGGNAPFLYSIDGINFQNSSVFNNLSDGSYTVYTKDADGFIATRNIVLNAPEPIEISTQIIGNDIIINASGGVGLFLYKLNEQNYQTDPIFSNLDNGIYTIEVQDANGCTENATVEIAIESLIAIGVLEENISCFGAADGMISLTAIGGIPPYQYISLNDLPSQNNNIFENLGAGTYEFIVQDANGMTFPINPITITEPSLLTLDVVVNNNDIIGFPNGGTGDIFFSLDSEIWQEEATFNNLESGDYTIYAKDEQDCIAMNMAVVEVTSTSSVDTKYLFKIYPNPTDDYVTIDFGENMSSQSTSILIYDINGRICLTKNIALQNQTTIDIAHLPKGVYQVEVLAGKQFFIERIVKY